VNYAELPAGNAGDVQLLEKELAVARPESAVIDDLMDKTVVARFTFISGNTLEKVLEMYSALKDPHQVNLVLLITSLHTKMI